MKHNALMGEASNPVDFSISMEKCNTLYDVATPRSRLFFYRLKFSNPLCYIIIFGEVLKFLPVFITADFVCTD